MINYSIIQDSHQNLLGTEAKHNDNLLTYQSIIVVRCSTFKEVTGLYTRAHVHIQAIISISGQSKTN